MFLRDKDKRCGKTDWPDLTKRKRRNTSPVIAHTTRSSTHSKVRGLRAQRPESKQLVPAKKAGMKGCPQLSQM
jgi:hypothetical protein